MDINDTRLGQVLPQFNWVERAIAVFSPKTAFERARVRLAANVAFRSYDAAGRGRRTSGWFTNGASANKETEMGLQMIRNRSRDLTRNNAYGKRAIQAIATNTIGSGIRPRIQGLTAGTDEKIKLLWNDWADELNCDWDGQGNFYSLQRLIMRTIAESGEVLVRRRRVKDGVIPLQIQVLEPDFLDSTKNTPIGITGTVNGTGEYDIQGVRFNKDGKRIGYWMYPVHPGEGAVMQSQLVPASEILHIYYKERPGQVRGVPFSTTAAISLYDFDEYEQAQLIRQKIAACFSVFVTDPAGDPVSGSPDDDNDSPLERVEPGMIHHLAAGEQISFATPPPLQNYDEYSKSMLRKIAVGFGISYEVLSGDLSNVNFSSGRMGWIEFGRLIKEWQELMLVPMMLSPIWNWFIEAALVAGKINRRVVKAGWTPPRREMIDPIKEIKGMSEAIRNGLHSWSDSVRQLGGDPDEVLAEIIRDNKKFEENEVMLDCNPRYDPTRQLADDALIPGDSNNTQSKTKKKK